MRAKPQDVSIRAEWRDGFEAAARHLLSLRWRYAFIHTYKPVLDDASVRAFDSMEQYRQWCEQHLPDWLGYAPFEYRQTEASAAARFYRVRLVP